LDVEALRADALEAVKDLSPAPWLHRRVVSGAYDPATSSVGSDVITETPVWGWSEPFKGAGFMFAGGSLVQTGDVKANIVCGQGVEAQAGDELDIAGLALKVVAVDPRPGLDMRVYDVCQVRRG
jgi:hypothetical protein